MVLSHDFNKRQRGSEGLDIVNGSRKALSRALVPQKTKKIKSKLSNKALVHERRVYTAWPDLVVVKLDGRPSQQVLLRPQEKTSALIAKIGQVASKPGASRTSVFRSSIGKRVYAYSVYPKDTTRIVREDATGNRSVGRLVNGRFRALSSRSS